MVPEDDDAKSVAESEASNITTREPRRRGERTQANIEECANAWEKEHEDLTREEENVITEHAKSAADLAMSAQMAAARVNKEADESKMEWNEHR